MTTSPVVYSFPLSWPDGWKRTAAGDRGRALFGVGSGPTPAPRRRMTVADAVDRLQEELRLLGAGPARLSSNVSLRHDGTPRSITPRPGHGAEGDPRDPGSAVYFQLQGQATVLACDRWDRVADNITALAMHIRAMRAMDRYGVGTTAQAFAGYAALPAHVDPWWTILELPGPTSNLEAVERAGRTLASRHHPDLNDGRREAWDRLQAALATARRELGAR